MKRKGSWKRDRKRERSPGTGCGLSGKEEEGSYLPPTQAWLGPIPLILETIEKSDEMREIELRV